MDIVANVKTADARMYDIFIVKIFVKYTEKYTNTMKYLLHLCGELKWEEYFLLTPFISPSLNELERGNNWKRSTHIAPLFFKERGRGDQEKASSAKPRRGLI